MLIIHVWFGRSTRFDRRGYTQWWLLPLWLGEVWLGDTSVGEAWIDDMWLLVEMWLGSVFIWSESGLSAFT